MIGKHVVIDTLDNFKAKLSLIPSSAIVLIKDVGQIYAHGTYFGAQKTYSLLTKTADGLAPKGGTSASSLISDVDTEWVLTVTNGENPTWRKLPANAFNSSSYTLPSATTSDLGGIKVGQVYTATFDDLVGQYYKINVDKNGLAYVHVPWINNPYTASGSGITLKDNVFSLSLNSVTKLDSAIGNKIYAVSLDKNGKLCVSVPWVDTNNIFVGATETINGSSGMVPAPIANQHNYFLRGDGTWVKPNLSDLNDDVVNGKYLPLSGGTISNSDYGALNIERKSNDGFSGIVFTNWSGINGYLGVGGSLSSFPKQPMFVNSSFESYQIWHSGTFNPSDYLPKSGGVLSGDISFGADGTTQNNTGTNTRLPSHIYRNVYDTSGNVYDHYFNLKYTASKNTFANLRVATNGGMKVLRFGGDGTFTWDGNTVIHSGNIGSQSVNYATDADKVDGYDSSDIFTYEGVTYRNGESSLWDSLGTKIYALALPDGLTDVYTYGQTISFGTPSAKFDMYVSHVATEPEYDGSIGGICVRSGWNTDRKSWRKLAFMDGNVASANKLKTSRTIWGQSFDGTNNVTGNLNLGYNKIYIGDGSDNYYIGWGAGNLYRYHNYYGHYFSTNSGEVMRITKSGNVGIGTESPSYKLHVKGNIYTSSNLDDGAGIVLNQEKTTAGYNAIRFATNGTTYAAIHGFDKGFGGYSWTYENLNLSSNIITLGPWNNPVVYITKNTTLTNSDGNVGIGTVKPSYNLDVQGDGRFTSGLIANNLVLNGNILSGSSSYTKSNPYQLSGNSRDSYVYTSMTCYLEAGNTYLMTCESNYVFCEHDRQDLSGYAGIFLRCETDSSHIYACSYTKNNLGCAGSWGFYCGVTGTYTLRFNTYKSGDVAKFWNISIKKAPVPSIGGCTSWGGYSISVGSSAGTGASTIYFVV